jgi:hypothetical protein
MDKEAIARVLASVPLEAPTRFGKGYGAPCLTVDQVERLTDALMSAQAERAKRLTGLGGRTSLIQDLERLKLWCRSKDPTAPIWLHIDEAIDTLRALDHVPPAAKATAILALQSSERGEADTVAFVQKWMMSGDHEADQWHRDFAAAIDARATLSPAEPSPESREGIIEQCAKVAEEYPSLEYADIAVVRGIASAIRALSAPAHD